MQVISNGVRADYWLVFQASQDLFALLIENPEAFIELVECIELGIQPDDRFLLTLRIYDMLGKDGEIHPFVRDLLDIKDEEPIRIPVVVH